MHKIENLYWKYDNFLNKLRLLYLNFLGAKVGNHVKVHGRFFIKYCNNFEIGDNSHINYGVFLVCRDKITIGKNVHLSSGVTIHTGGLNLNEIESSHFTKPVVIEDNVWITTGVIINPGVTIGKNSVVLPGSVVNKDIAENSMVGGVPAKLIKKINKVEEIK